MEAPKPCAVCNAPKAPKTCELCAAAICKACQEVLGSSAFLYLKQVPANLAHASYCSRCYDQQVAPALAAYEVTATKAEDVYFLTQAYKGYVHVLERHTERVEIDDCDDRRELILKMAFMAAELGHNAIIQAKVQSSSVNNGGYHSSRWRGSSLPATIDGAQLERTSLMRI